MAKGVIVLGMHRSGTSLVTRMLNLSGFDIGPDNIIMKPDPVFNPKGYWERTDIVEINDRALYSIGCSWWKVSKLDINRVSQYERQLYGEKLKEIIASFPEDKPYVIKDPRMILTYPLWKDILTDVYFVVVHREPVEIAMSLHSRNKTPMFFGLILWEYYLLKYSLFLKNKQFTSINYGSLITNPEYFTKILFSELNSAGFTMPEVSPELLATIDMELYRHKALDYYNEKYITAHTKKISAAMNDKKIDEIEKLISSNRTDELLELLMIYEEFVAKYNPE